MILPDVNVLVLAFREVAPDHEVYARWLNQTVQVEDLLVPDAVVTGFLRVVTLPSVIEPTVTARQALRFVDRLTSGWLLMPHSSRIVMSRLQALIEADPGIRGNLLPDAYLAATALTHNARLATRDRGFARYPGLRWFDPADEARSVRR